MINLLEPSGFGTKKYVEINCSSQSSHFSIACLANSFSISTFILLNSSVVQLGSFGGLTCLGDSLKGILYPFNH